MRPNAIQIIRDAAQHPSLVPVPDYVLNDEVRNMTVEPDALVFHFSDGTSEPVVTNGHLMSIHQELLD